MLSDFFLISINILTVILFILGVEAGVKKLLQFTFFHSFDWIVLKLAGY
jgi:hypothetical protein